MTPYLVLVFEKIIIALNLESFFRVGEERE